MSNLLEMPRKRVLGILLACLAGLFILIIIARTSNNAPSTKDIPVSFEDNIVASVNGEPIYQTQLNSILDKFGENNGQLDEYQALEHLIEQKLLSQHAEKVELNAQIEIQNKLQLARDRILAREMIDDFVKQNITEDELRSFYDTQSKLQGPELQIKARQIVSPDKATAKEVVRRLDDGKSFASIALAFSIDRATRENGGDIGYISRDVLDPALTAKIFEGEDGERLEPFETSQGWHVVEIISRRMSPVASFEDRYEEIRKLVSAQKVEQFLDSLKDNADISYLAAQSDSKLKND